LDIDYGNYLEASPSVSDWFRDLLDRAVWKYTSVLMAQPFDVAKTILQVYVVPAGDNDQNTTDDRRRPNHQFQDDFSDEVCSI
jgi:fusion and transport protein UGO1